MISIKIADVTAVRKINEHIIPEVPLWCGHPAKYVPYSLIVAMHSGDHYTIHCKNEQECDIIHDKLLGINNRVFSSTYTFEDNADIMSTTPMAQEFREKQTREEAAHKASCFLGISLNEWLVNIIFLSIIILAIVFGK